MYRVAEKSPSPDQYATIIWFGLFTYTWLLVQWIRMCTLMLDTQTYVSHSPTQCVPVLSLTHPHSLSQLSLRLPLPLNVPQWSRHGNDRQSLVCHVQQCKTTWRKTWMWGRIAQLSWMNCRMATDLRRAVEDVFRTITPKMLRRMSQRTWRHIRLCVQHQGAHTDPLDK